MNLALSHAAELLGEAVEALVASGPVRDRVHAAAQVLLGITPQEFDRFPDLKEAHLNIRTRLSVLGDEQQGSFAASAAAMTDRARRSLVLDIVALDRMIRDTK